MTHIFLQKLFASWNFYHKFQTQICRNVYTLKFDWIQRKLSWTLMGMEIVVMGSKHLRHLSSLQWERYACYIRSRMGLGRERPWRHTAQGEEAGSSGGDGETEESFLCRWVRRGHTHKSQVYSRLDFSRCFSSWHCCWVGLTPSSETFQATRSQENQVQLKPLRYPSFYVIIKTILKQQETWKTGSAVSRLPQYSHFHILLSLFSFYPFANWQVAVGRGI